MSNHTSKTRPVELAQRTPHALERTATELDSTNSSRNRARSKSHGHDAGIQGTKVKVTSQFFLCSGLPPPAEQPAAQVVTLADRNLNDAQNFHDKCFGSRQGNRTPSTARLLR
jgi:hypothetical protein